MITVCRVARCQPSPSMPSIFEVTFRFLPRTGPGGLRLSADGRLRFRSPKVSGAGRAGDSCSRPIIRRRGLSGSGGSGGVRSARGDRRGPGLLRGFARGLGGPLRPGRAFAEVFCAGPGASALGRV
jgi:hypothetical protein